MNRRGFFSRFTSAFNRRQEGDLFFYGLQVVINVYGEDELRARLHRVIAQETTTEYPADKRIFYKRIVALLRDSQPFFEYGYWDYLGESDGAVDEFNNWVDEIEASSATVEEEIGDDVDSIHRFSAEKSYVVVTLAFLLEYSQELDDMIGLVESIEEDDYFSPSGFQRLLDAVNYIDFEYSHGDAVFIMPGNEQDGFSWMDMRGEGWEYLKPIMGTIN